MDLERHQQLLTRWIDGELEGDELREFEQAATDDPQLRAAKAEAEELRTMLKSELAEHHLPNPDFFNSQIQRRISEEAAPAAPAKSNPGASILSWFRSPFTLASAAAVLAIGLFVLSQPNGGSTPDHTSIASTYTPDKAIAASHFYSDEADATVIMLDGLAALPDSLELKGQNIVSADHGTPGELYNENQQLAFVVFRGADSVPVLRSFR